MPILQRGKHFFQNCTGVAAIEFATAVPLLLLLFIGGFEVNRFMLINEKAEKISYTVTDVIAQSSSLTNQQLNQIMSAATQIMLPHAFGEKGIVIVSSVYKSGNTPPQVNWRYTGGGTLARTSQIGAVNATATLPGGLTLNDKDNIIIAEIYYRYTPVTSGSILFARDLYKSAIFKPRLGALTTAPT